MPPPPSELARQLVLRHGWNSTAYQILNPGIQHWFNADRSAVVGHVNRAGVFMAAGAPVCDAAILPGVITELERTAARQNLSVCYFACAARLHDALQNSPHHSTLAIGAEPVWDPRNWPNIVARRPSLRAQLHRAQNKNVTIHAALPADHTHDPELQSCLHQWLAHRGLPPLHFMVEPQTLAGTVNDRQLWIARRKSPATSNESPAVAFLLASPVPARNGWLIEQIVRTPAAPNGTVELLINAAMRDLAAQDAAYVTLGLVALSPHAAHAMQQNPWWFRALTRWARAHSRRFYNFDGLEAFRQKLAPDSWETIYAISNEKTLSPKTLYAIAAAFSAGSPMRLAAQTLAKALLQELHWLHQKLRPTERVTSVEPARRATGARPEQFSS